MKDLKETEKNFFTCAILTVLVGIGLLLLGKHTTGILSITAGIVFAAIGIRMVLERRNKERKNDGEHGAN